MTDNRLNKKQEKVLMDFMEKIYKAAISYEASENADYLEEIYTTNDRIQSLLNAGAYRVTDADAKQLIDETSQRIQKLTSQLQKSAVQYFTEQNQELLNTVTEMLSKIEETFIR
jgi:hypothetical protein